MMLEFVSMRVRSYQGTERIHERLRCIATDARVFYVLSIGLKVLMI
jgi:hypothetical protein